MYPWMAGTHYVVQAGLNVLDERCAAIRPAIAYIFLISHEQLQLLSVIFNGITHYGSHLDQLILVQVYVYSKAFPHR